MASDTRERLIMAAMELFAEKGYESTSVADILKTAGVNSGSLYHFFPTKQALLVEVLDTYYRGIGPMLLEPAWAHVDDPIEKVFALLAAYRRMLEESECTYGCPIGSLALELHEPDPEVRERLSANFIQWADKVRACLDAADLAADVDRGKLATLVLTVMEGGVMQARTHRSLETFDDGVTMLRDYIDRLRVSR